MSLNRITPESTEDSSTDSSVSRLWTALTVWDFFALVIPLVGILPLLYLQGIFLWSKEHLQFFPLAFAAAIYFFYQEGEGCIAVSRGRSRVALCGAISSILVSLLALVFYSAWLAHFALLGIVLFWALGRLGNLSVLRVVGIWGLMVVTLPPPFGWDHVMVQQLQLLSSSVSSKLMDITNIVHIRSGNVIEIASQKLFVEEACSGVDSQYALMAVAGVLLLVGRTGFVVSLLTIVTVPIWAILGNLLRIYSIAFGLEIVGVDLSRGTTHTLLGLVTFSVSAWAHWSSVQFLNWLSLYVPSNLNATESSDSGSVALVDGMHGQFRDLSRWWLIMPGLILLLTPVAVIGVVERQFRLEVPLMSVDLAERFPGEKELPRRMHDAERVGYYTQERSRTDSIGQHSRIWSYSGRQVSHVACLDMPFRGWHPLVECYGLIGWTKKSARKVDADASGNPLAWPYFEYDLVDKEGKHGLLLFSLFDREGKPYRYDGNYGQVVGDDRAARSILPTLSKLLATLSSPPEPLTFQFQLLTTSNEPVSEENRTKSRLMFLELREVTLMKSIPALSELELR